MVELALRGLPVKKNRSRSNGTTPLFAAIAVVDLKIFPVSRVFYVRFSSL